LVYLTTLQSDIRHVASNGTMAVNQKRKKAAVAYY